MSVYQNRLTGEAGLDREDAAGLQALALPSANEPHMTRDIPGQLFPEPAPCPIPKLRSETSGRQLYSKEQWEARKPVIYRLYNLENKPYNRVVEILRTEYNLFPTRRQFYRKINEWGFEKNIKEREMRAIAQTLEVNKTGGAPTLKGRQVDVGKIQRWQKRQGRMKGIVCSVTNQPANNVISENTEGHEPSLCHAGNPTILPIDMTSASPANVMESSQSFSIWATVDVPRSPKLSRLLEALKIECPFEIPPISIGSPFAEVVESYVADIPTEEISQSDQAGDTTECTAHGACFMSSNSSVVPWSNSIPSSHSKWSLPNESFDEWALAHWDFSKGSAFDFGIKMGPMKPLSPFPMSPTTGARRGIAFTSSMSSGRVLTLDRAELIYKNKLTSYGFENRETIYAQLQFLKVLTDHGRFKQVAKIHEPLHALILRLFGPEDDLALLSTTCMSDTYYGLGQAEESDKLDRQVLQIQLNTLGPRHRETLRLMRRVACSLRDSGKLLESVQLFNIIIQLQYGVGGIHEHTVYYNELQLAIVISCQGRHRESMNLALKAAKRSEISRGMHSAVAAHCHYQVARCLDSLGQHEESEKLLKKVLEQNLKGYGEYYLSTVETTAYMANMFYKSGRFQECVPLYEKCLRARIENYGLEASITIRTCGILGLCYEKLGRYGDALGLYWGTIDQLSSENGDDFPATAMIQGWVAELREFLVAEQEDTYPGQGELGVGENLRSEGGSAVEGKSGEYGHPVDDGGEVNRDDWMNCFVDFQTPK